MAYALWKQKESISNWLLIIYMVSHSLINQTDLDFTFTPQLRTTVHKYREIFAIKGLNFRGW